MRSQPLVCVTDVEASSGWYQRLLGCRGAHGGRHYDQLVKDGWLILQLHSFDVEDHHGPIGNRADRPYGNGVLLWFEVDDFDAAAILSRDTSADVERLQIEAWRRMTSLEKTALLSQATHDVVALALSGIRQRHPGASERECFIRLAALQLGPTLVRQVYPDAAQILGPHV